jgi:pimeloyl-ACP methyl ester carboxylesterase
MTLAAVVPCDQGTSDVTDLQTFSSDGVEIAYLDSAADGRLPAATRPTPVLLIHGFASNIGTNWVHTGWVALLRDAGYRVIALDNRGHGASAKLHDPADYGAPTMAEDARRLLDHLGVGRAHVMGYSMGARIAAFLVLAHPGRVASVTFSGLGGAITRGLGDSGDRIAAALEAPSLEDVPPGEGRAFRQFADQTRSDRRALAACMRSGRLPITAAQLAEIRCPVLVVVGTADEIAGSPAELAAAIPGARWIAPEGRDHMKTVGDRAFKEAALAHIAAADLSRGV